MLSATKARYAECRYAECHYSECRGTKKFYLIGFNIKINMERHVCIQYAEIKRTFSNVLFIGDE